VPAPDLAARNLIALPSTLKAGLPVADLARPTIVRAGVAATRPDWIDNIVATPARRTARRQALEQRYGVKRGRVNGLDQYVATTGDTTCEVLVNGDAVVPVELNVARSGLLASHSLFTHESWPDGVLVRRLLHAERAVPERQGSRLLTDVSLTSVVLTPAVAP
jgi:hypothetical protein